MGQAPHLFVGPAVELQVHFTPACGTITNVPLWRATVLCLPSLYMHA